MTSTNTATGTDYRTSAMHRLTVAAIYTPYGQPIVDAKATHDAHCTTCK